MRRRRTILPALLAVGTLIAAPARAASPPSIEAVATGRKMPDFSLPQASGGTVSLSDLIASGPAVIVIFRGVW